MRRMFAQSKTMEARSAVGNLLITFCGKESL